MIDLTILKKALFFPSLACETTGYSFRWIPLMISLGKSTYFKGSCWHSKGYFIFTGNAWNMKIKFQRFTFRAGLSNLCQHALGKSQSEECQFCWSHQLATQVWIWYICGESSHIKVRVKILHVLKKWKFKV